MCGLNYSFSWLEYSFIHNIIGIKNTQPAIHLLIPEVIHNRRSRVIEPENKEKQNKAKEQQQQQQLEQRRKDTNPNSVIM